MLSHYWWFTDFTGSLLLATHDCTMKESPYFRETCRPIVCWKMYRCNLGMLKDSTISYFLWCFSAETLLPPERWPYMYNLGCNFLWRAACYHKCFPLNSSSVPGCYSLSDVNSQGMSPCSTTLMHSSAQDVAKYYLQRLTLHCVLWANITVDMSQEKEFSFSPLFLSLLFILVFCF